MSTQNVSVSPTALPIDRTDFDVTMKRRFFYAPGFSLYNGTKGLYDYGPAGSAIKSNILSLWRNHFVIEEDMLEVSCTSVTPEKVFIASGHVEKFTDLMVRNEETKGCYRADHLLEDTMDELLKNPKLDEATRAKYVAIRANADNYSLDQLAALFEEFNIKDPEPQQGKSDVLSKPFDFNLMFETGIGPSGDHKDSRGFLRPELAQGIFLNFPRLLEYNGGRLPFAGTQIGTAYRNEINPRNGLLRVREFELAEIEHFVDPIDKSHPKFHTVAHVELTLQQQGEMTERGEVTQMTLGTAVERGIIANQTLAYFMGRTQLFLLQCGAAREFIRFRQHGKNEMAHYACDCWDAELLTSYGWIECVGHADRQDYDLRVHAEATNSAKQMVYWRDYAEPREVEQLTIKVNKKTLGPKYGKECRTLIPHLANLSPEEVASIQASFEADGSATTKCGDKEYPLTPDLLTFNRKTVKLQGEHVMPHVIEPSYGIGRILYGVLEHCFWIRDPADPSKKVSLDKLAEIKAKQEGTELMRNVLGLTPAVAPVKASVIPLISGNQAMRDKIPDLVSQLKRKHITSRVDSSKQAIGRRYARTDEIGIPYGIVIDHQTLEDNTVTLRERDSTKQVRIPAGEELAGVLRSLCDGFTTWGDITSKYPSFGGNE